jgi:hypothetical protein
MSTRHGPPFFVFFLCQVEALHVLARRGIEPIQRPQKDCYSLHALFHANLSLEKAELVFQSWQIRAVYTYWNGTNAVEYLKPTRSPDGIQGFLKQFSKIVKKNYIKCLNREKIGTT